MARLTIGQKTHRMLAFLMGLANRDIAQALQQFGFDQAALDEGWALLRRTAAVRLDDRQPERLSREEIAQLDAWENRWFPIASAVLQRHHPAVHTQVFHNLTQTKGPEVVLSVGTLVSRIDVLPDGDESTPKGTLARHGLTEPVLAEARDLLVRVTQPAAGEPPPVPETPEGKAAAEAAMWAYYLQWSAIARSAISDRRLLRKLGFLRSQRAGTPADDIGEDGDGDTGDDTDDQAA